MAATRLLILPYLQQWTGSSLELRVLLIPRGSPLEPLDPLTPGSRPFAKANFTFDIHIASGLDSLPIQDGTAFATITAPAAPDATVVFETLAREFEVDPSPASVARPPTGTRVMKYLPISYQKAVNYSPGRTNLVVTGSEYRCALKAGPSELANLPPMSSKIPWGKVVAMILRNPTIGVAAGLIRPISIPVASGDTLKKGGYVYVTLSGTSDGASLIGRADSLKLYASRISPITSARDLFTAALFPVPRTPTSMNYDEVFEEVDNYADGWAKAVHCGQLQQLDPMAESPDGTRPVSELGIRIGWDDEQVTIWMNRQLDPDLGTLDCPLGVSGYRIDSRVKGSSEWFSLVRAAGELGIGDHDLGPFDGDLGVETHPVQLEAKRSGTHWLPTYFTGWRGPSLVGLDAIQLLLDSGPDKTEEPGVRGVTPGVSLRYGNSYEFRVRLKDTTSGGPTKDGSPIVAGPHPVESCEFRRWIRPLEPSYVEPVPVDPDPVNPPTSLKLRRPLLQYPAVNCTGFYPNPIDALKADIPAAKSAGRKPGLPDPDVDRVEITIEVQGLMQDTATSNGGFMVVATTTRPFPSDPYGPIVLDLAWIDVSDVAALEEQEPTSGPLLLPTARTVRLRIMSLCKDDPSLEYFGAQDVRRGQDTQAILRKNSTDEGNLFLPEPPSNHVKALYLQPELPGNSAVAAAQKLAGKPNERLTDNASRLSTALGLLNDGLTLRGKPGRRVVFGASANLRHATGPDLASIRFGSQSDLVQHWLIAIRMTLNRDWSWDGFQAEGIVIRRGMEVVDKFVPNRNVTIEALDHLDRTQTDLIFFDAFDPKPANGQFPREIELEYTVSWSLQGLPSTDPPLALSIRLPVTTPPAQTPRLVSAGIAMAPYERQAGTYASSQPRRRGLWLEFDSPPADSNDTYFARVLRNAPDPVLTAESHPPMKEAEEPPLGIDPEPIRTVIPNQSDDSAGLDAMQPLVPSDETRKVHWMLPLPPGMDEASPELFGFFKYELRVGHVEEWSTAQGRFGAPLQVAGVQHPPPPLLCDVVRTAWKIIVTAPYAFPVLDGKPMQPIRPLSTIWVLLYAQAEQLDGKDRRNVLLERKLANRPLRPKSGAANYGTAVFDFQSFDSLIRAYGFDRYVPLSVLAVEMMPQGRIPEDPLGADLGGQRILRTSNLTPVPHGC